MFPTDLRIAKFLIFGTILGCVETTLTIAACISGKPIFVSPLEKRDEAKEYPKSNPYLTHILEHGNNSFWVSQTGYQLVARLMIGPSYLKDVNNKRFAIG